MAISKIILNGEVQMDVTSDTVTAGSMLSGTTATKNDGTKATGTIVTRTSSDLTASGATVTVPSGYYSAQASKAVASGTAGTPTATKGTASNHSVSVTPSVTNQTGYISGGTINGTAVTVSASELVSGTYSVTSSGTKDVTNYASASVPSGTAGTPTATKGTVSNHSISITPSVTNTTGFITGNTKTGTAVTVSVSELVSGTKTITENDTGIDVTNYASVDVNVSGGSMQVGEFTVNSSVSTNRVNVGYIDYVQPYFVHLASRGTQSRTGHCPIADDGFMYVTFTGSSATYTPSVTATSGTATLETSWEPNAKWNGLDMQGLGRIYKLSPNAVVTLTYYNSN